MPAPSNLPAFFDREILPRLAVEDVYQDIEFTARVGRYWRGLCQMHPERGAADTFWVDPQTLRWFCLEHCGKGGQSPLAYWNAGRPPQLSTGEYRQGVEKAAALARVVVPDLPNPTVEEERSLVQRERVACLLETFAFHTHRLLFAESSPQPSRDAALQFLANRGFDPAGLDTLPVGLFPDSAAARRHLREAGFSAQEIEASELTADDRLPGRLVGPIRDPLGRIVSFWARHPEDHSPRFLFKGKWKEEIGLFGLDVALHPAAGGHDNLVVVEHLLDALLLQSKGLRNVAAVAGSASDLKENRWRCLLPWGLRRLTLALDYAIDNPAALAEILEPLYRVHPPFDVYLLLRDSLEERRSMGDRLLACNTEQFQSLLGTHSVHAYSYKAYTILEEYKAGHPWTEARRHAAWKAAIEFYVSAGRENTARLDVHFVPLVVAGLGRTWEAFEPCGDAEPEPVVETEPPASQEKPPIPVAAARSNRDFCPLHRCPATVCFCFD